MKNKMTRMLLASLTSMMLLAGCHAVNLGSITPMGMGNDVLMKIDETEYSTMSGRIYLSSLVQQAENAYGNQVWDQNVNGTNVGKEILNNAEDYIYQIILLGHMAKEEGISLNDQEETQIQEAVARYLADCEAATDGSVPTEEEVTEAFGCYILCTKYEARTRELAAGQIDPEEARVVALKQISIPFETVDEKAYAVKAMKYIKKQLKNGVSFNALAARLDQSEGIELTAARGTLSPDAEDFVFALKEGEYSEVLQEENRYVIYQCIDESDETATQKQSELLTIEKADALCSSSLSKYLKNNDIKWNTSAWKNMDITKVKELPGADFFAIANEFLD